MREIAVDKKYSGLIQKYNEYFSIIYFQLSQFAIFLQTISTENEKFKYLNDSCYMLKFFKIR